MNQTQNILDMMDLVSKHGLQRAGHLLLDASQGIPASSEEHTQNSGFLDLSPSDLRRYSLSAAINSVLPGVKDENSQGGLERECSQALTKRFDVPLGCIAVPADVLHYRSPRPEYTVGVSAPQGLSFIDGLRQRLIAVLLGARLIGDLRDNLAVPRQTATTTMTWIGPGGSVTASDSAFGQVSATPKTAIIITEVSEQLLAQSSADAIISQGLAADLAAGVDAAVINGAGGKEPLGILNGPIGTFSGTSLAYAGLVGVQKTIADSNAILNGSALGYAFTPTTAEQLKNRQRFTSTDSPLWRGALHDGEIEGVRAVASKNMPASTGLYGDWSTVVIGSWGPLMLSADRGGTRFNQGQVGIRALWFLDVFMTSPTSFVKITSIT